MLQACLNGGRRTGRVPVTPAQLAADAAAAVRAGAAELHLHPRGAAGAETLAKAEVAACLAAVREAVPGVPVGIGTGDWIAPGGRARHADIAAWEAVPDYCSVNLGEADAPDVIALLRGKGIGIEAGLWNLADAERFLCEIDPSHCLRLLVEMPDIAPAAARDGAGAILGLLAPLGRPILLHGEGASAWAMIALAAELGLDSRVGFEDTLDLPDGRPAPDNASLVEAARALLDGGRA